jgi:hypothetical protein
MRPPISRLMRASRLLLLLAPLGLGGCTLVAAEVGPAPGYGYYGYRQPYAYGPPRPRAYYPPPPRRYYGPNPYYGYGYGYRPRYRY